MQNVPPYLTGALPSSGSETAEELYELHISFIRKARTYGLKIVSFGADGAATERNAQQLLSKPSSTSKVVCFSDKFFGIQFSTPVIDKVVLVTVQDPKHAKKKPSRNQMFGGARLFTFTSSTVWYDQVLTAQKEGSTLLVRDVINVIDKMTWLLFALSQVPFLMKL